MQPYQPSLKLLQSLHYTPMKPLKIEVTTFSPETIIVTPRKKHRLKPQPNKLRHGVHTWNLKTQIA